MELWCLKSRLTIISGIFLSRVLLLGDFFSQLLSRVKQDIMTPSPYGSYAGSHFQVELNAHHGILSFTFCR